MSPALAAASGPDLLSLICTVRSGSRREKLLAARRLGTLAADERQRGALLSAGALHSLAHLVSIAADGWPDVELEASRAMATLVPSVDDPALLLRYSHAVLQALRLLLEARDDPQAQGQGALAGGLGEDSYDRRRQVAANALAHLAVVLQHEFKNAALGGAPGERPPLWSPAPPSRGAGAGAGAGLGLGLAQEDTAKLLEAIVVALLTVCGRGAYRDRGSISWSPQRQPRHESQGGGGEVAEESISRGPSGSAGYASLPGLDDDATMLAAFSISQLAQYEGSRVMLVNRGVLSVLMAWLQSSCRDLKRHAACTIASLCFRPDERSSSGLLADLSDHALSARSNRVDVYTMGW
jgi:hypothetical protein